MAVFVASFLRRHGEKIATYIALWTGSLLGAAILWCKYVTGEFYYISDEGSIRAFFPPFLHGAQDYYVTSAAEVWVLWGCYVTGIFCFPAIIMIAFDFLHRLFLKRAGRTGGERPGSGNRRR